MGKGDRDASKVGCQKCRNRHQEGERFAVSQILAAMLHGNGKTQAENIMAFWNYWNALPERNRPLQGICFAAGEWLKEKLKI